MSAGGLGGIGLGRASSGDGRSAVLPQTESAAPAESPLLPLALALFSGLSTGPALDLNAVTLQQTAAFNGRIVRACVTVVNPPDAIGWWTVAGDDTGAVVRSVVVPKDLRLNPRDTLTVVGVLEVIRHPAVVVNGVMVPGWEEVRVTGWRVRCRKAG